MLFISKIKGCSVTEIAPALKTSFEEYITRIIVFGIFGYEKKELWTTMRKQCSYHTARVPEELYYAYLSTAYLNYLLKYGNSGNEVRALFPHGRVYLRLLHHSHSQR